MDLPGVTTPPDNGSPPAPAQSPPSGSWKPPERQRLPDRNPWKRRVGVALLAASLLAAGIFAATHTNSGKASVEQDATQRFDQQSASLSNLAGKLGASTNQSQLTVNGQFNLNGQMVLQPSTQPASPVAGQLYFDQGGNQLKFYNGTQFVSLGGGGNTFVTNGGSTTNITNVTNVSGGGGNVTASGTAGDIAMFTGAGTLGDSVINQAGTNLTVGSNSGASSTVLQGGTGNVSINTAANAGTGGAITIQTGDSSTTAAGNVTIDTGNSQLSGTVIDTKDFEDGTTDNFGDGIFGDNSTVVNSTAQAESGTHSLAISVGSFFYPSWSTGEGTGNPPCSTRVTAGHTYAFTAWARAATTSDNITGAVTWTNDGYYGGGEISTQNWGTITDLSTSWHKMTGVLTAPALSYSICLHFSAADAQAIGETHYFDNITVTDLSASTAQATINIGATNAQALVLGNSAMFAPTNIYGGGINLNGATGIINLNAGTIQASSGTGTYTTTSGALNITSATTASWGIGGNLFGNSLTIHGGGAGGNNNGGSLVLQGGTGSGTGAAGVVAVKPVQDSTSAFDIEDSAGYQVLGVDTVGHSVDVPGWSLVTPYGGFGNYGNLLQFSEQFDNAAWAKDAGTSVVADNVAAPNGTMTADTITTTVPTNSVGQTVAVAPSTTYTFSWWAKGGTMNATDYEVFDNTNSVVLVAAHSYVTGFGWRRYSVVFTTGATTNSATVMPLSNSGVTGTVALWGAQLEQASSVGVYQPTQGTPVATESSGLLVTGNNFQVQSATGAALLAADTSAMTVTVKALIVTADLTVNGHIITGGSAPGIAAGAAACTTPTVSISGNDTSGTITVTTGTGCAAPGTLATVTFAAPFGTAPHVTLTPGGSTALSLGAFTDDATVSTTGFTLGTNTTPANSTNYQWNYLVTQ